MFTFNLGRLRCLFILTTSSLEYVRPSPMSDVSGICIRSFYFHVYCTHPLYLGWSLSYVSVSKFSTFFQCLFWFMFYSMPFIPQETMFSSGLSALSSHQVWRFHLSFAVLGTNIYLQYFEAYVQLPCVFVHPTSCILAGACPIWVYLDFIFVFFFWCPFWITLYSISSIPRETTSFGLSGLFPHHVPKSHVLRSLSHQLTFYL